MMDEEVDTEKIGIKIQFSPIADPVKLNRILAESHFVGRKNAVGKNLLLSLPNGYCRTDKTLVQDYIEIYCYLPPNWWEMSLLPVYAPRENVIWVKSLDEKKTFWQNPDYSENKLL